MTPKPYSLIILSSVSRWFHPSFGRGKLESHDYALLGLILAAGAWLRFWGLGYAGLHGDEDIMGLAARGLLEQGEPVLPSGMVYVRALLHTYVIAASMYVFGETEWAMRLPSAVVGSLVGLLAFLMGRRFLDPKLSLLFAAVMTFLPVMIEISQTARMYVFFVAGLLAFGTLLFKWEATGKLSWFFAALAMWLLTFHFHALAVFAAPLFLFPGLSTQSWKRLLQGAGALVAAFLVYNLNRSIVSQYYPGEESRLAPPADTAASPLALLFEGIGAWSLGLGAAAIILVAAAGLVGVQRRAAMLPPTLLLVCATIGFTLLHYHIAAIALLFGIILWFRTGGASYVRLIPAVAVLTLMTVVQIIYLRETTDLTDRQVIGALVGTPSVWPAIRFAELSPVAAAAYLMVGAIASTQLARGLRLPIHFLFFALSVWAPLMAIGLFNWYPPTRYMLGLLPFFMLCVIAGIAYVLRAMRADRWLAAPPTVKFAAGLALVLALVNPVAMMIAASNDYRIHPDHKGAAEFVRSLNLEDDDILIAEDSINQTFYLGGVDFRLLSTEAARTHSVLQDGTLFGQYTGTPVIGSGAELEAFLDQHRAGFIYIIGSGEDFEDGRQYMRGDGITDVLASHRLKVIHEGRDGRTKVWRSRPGAEEHENYLSE